MVLNGRGVGIVLSCIWLFGCVQGKPSPPRLPHETPEGNELSDANCPAGVPSDDPPFDGAAAEGALKHAMDRAWSSGLHTASHFDLSITMSWGNAGCVAEVTLEEELPSSLAECLMRRFRDATIKPFRGQSPSVQVRMTNDRAWWTWL